MNRGDTLTIVLDYTVDGAPITEGQFDEIGRLVREAADIVKEIRG